MVYVALDASLRGIEKSSLKLLCPYIPIKVLDFIGEISNIRIVLYTYSVLWAKLTPFKW